MKKFVFCFVAVASLIFASCDKSNPADDFVGDYNVSAHATFHNIPLVGDYSQDINDLECSIVKKGDDGDVTLTMSGTSAEGYVDDKGLHVDPIQIQQELMGTPVTVGVTFPVIKAPKNGTITWVSTLSASAMGVALTGEAEMTAVKK